MKRIFIFVTLLCVLGLSGCSTMDIVSDYDESYNYDQLKTYAWLSGIRLQLGDGRIDDRTIEMRIKAAVETELNQKGFKKVENGQEDFLVGFSAALNAPLYRDKLYEYRETEVGRGTIIYEEKSAYKHPAYDAGTVIIDVISPETSKIIWRGSAQSSFQIDYVSTEKKKERLKKAVNQILKGFPPKV